MQQRQPLPPPSAGYPSVFSLSGDYAAQQSIPAGFWMRVAAHLIDAVVLNIPWFLVRRQIPPLRGGALPEVPTPEQFLSYLLFLCTTSLIMLVVGWFYYALMETSANQGTLGKMALGLKVTDMEGQPITFGRASGRYFGKLLSSLTLCVGYLMAGWTEKKQALHDILANTLVVRK